MTGVLGNGQHPCCPLPCEFSQKCYFCENSSLFYLPAIRGGNDAVQKLASVPIFELRVFAPQKLGMAFVHRHPWRGGTDAVQVFHSKNSLLFYLPAVLGGNGLRPRMDAV